MRVLFDFFINIARWACLERGHFDLSHSNDTVLIFGFGHGDQ